MNLQALLIRATVSIAAATALAAGIALDYVKPAAAVAAPIQSPKPAIRAASANAIADKPVVLPTIHVRASLAQRAAAEQSTPTTASGMAVPAVLEVEVSTPATRPLSGLRTDMPYYSFGKSLPRIGSKE
ncbi:MAG: hypothetical protein JSR27_01505 [Proteobacteria bacterium]|nr:hypothetical protein [Pseudomonadota bacterium]